MALAVAGCSSSNGGNGGGAAGAGGTADHETPGTAGHGAGTATGGLTCLGVLQCVGDCPEATAEACADACLARTLKSSQAVTEALEDCLERTQCADATCIQTQCKDELAACIADDASAVSGGEKPPAGTTPTGSVPPELVGVWGRVGLSDGTSFTFEADGSTIFVASNKTASSYCDYGFEVKASGVTTVSKDTLVFHRLEGTVVTESCDKPTGKALDPADITYRYTLGANEEGAPELSLSLVDDGVVSDAPMVLHH